MRGSTSNVRRISTPSRSAGLTREELEFILVHEEFRRVPKTAAITYYGHYYRVLDEYIKRRVWTKLKGTNLTVECGGEAIARHTLREERYQDIPKDSR